MSTERQNIEIKIEVPDLADIRARAVSLGAVFQWSSFQIDTYFQVPHGRLKMRTVDTSSAGTLISYQRPDTDSSRISHYRLLPVSDAETLTAMLGETLGVLTVVQKTRQLFLFGKTRIHLDVVDGLGSFVELETVIEDQSPDEAWTEHRLLIERLNAGMHKRVAIGYSDLSMKSR